MTLTNAVGAPDTHWGRILFPLDRAIEVAAGTPIQAELHCDPAGPGQLRVLLVGPDRRRRSARSTTPGASASLGARSSESAPGLRSGTLLACGQRLLVLSPHLDDAVLSLGGAIAAWVAAGERVVIATVYTTGPPLAEIAPAMRVFADYATRTREDDAACAVLGAEQLRLGLVERAFRRPFLTDLAYFTTPADRADYALARGAPRRSPTPRTATP